MQGLWVMVWVGRPRACRAARPAAAGSLALAGLLFSVSSFAAIPAVPGDDPRLRRLGDQEWLRQQERERAQQEQLERA